MLLMNSNEMSPPIIKVPDFVPVNTIGIAPPAREVLYIWLSVIVPSLTRMKRWFVPDKFRLLLSSVNEAPPFT